MVSSSRSREFGSRPEKKNSSFSLTPGFPELGLSVKGVPSLSAIPLWEFAMMFRVCFAGRCRYFASRSEAFRFADERDNRMVQEFINGHWDRISL